MCVNTMLQHVVWEGKSHRVGDDPCSNFVRGSEQWSHLFATRAYQLCMRRQVCEAGGGWGEGCDRHTGNPAASVLVH